MPRNAYYTTPHWRALRREALRRDGNRCTAPGCGSTDGLVVDHVRTRPNSDASTPLDVLANLRTLCGYHDRQVKEMANGTRRRGGELTTPGVDANGMPIDPRHPWNIK